MAQRADVAAQSLEDATVALINSDQQLRDQLRDLISTTIARAKHQMEYGDPGTRTALIKSALPNFVKAMGRVESTAGQQEMQQAYDRIRKGIADEPESTTGAS